ncbi:MAG: ParB/RepB/Spo0J family partition protein [Nitrospira sp.]|nr:ParB/RepB/Spo0J family partition protein [Nitrospira sp.]MBS0194348.1 ParB/RepB/Spo0J family partition protein [Pseudomonadota bacterium]
MALDLSGLDALTAGLDHVSSGGIKRVALNHIDPDPEQPRRKFNGQALSELAASITAHGVIQPIVVRQQPGGGYLIVSGERRWRAAKQAGLEDIPVVVRDDLDGFAQMVENIQREDLTPAEIYRWIAAQVEAGTPKGVLAEKLGKSNAWISAYATIAKMPEVFQVALAEGLAADVTALGHLHKLWKSEPAAAERMLRGGEPITRYSVSALAERLAAKGSAAPELLKQATKMHAKALEKPMGGADLGDADETTSPTARSAHALPVRMLASYQGQAWAVIYTEQKKPDGGSRTPLVLLVNEGGMELFAPLEELRLTAINSTV